MNLKVVILTAILFKYSNTEDDTRYMSHDISINDFESEFQEDFKILGDELEQPDYAWSDDESDTTSTFKGVTQSSYGGTFEDNLSNHHENSFGDPHQEIVQNRTTTNFKSDTIDGSTEHSGEHPKNSPESSFGDDNDNHYQNGFELNVHDTLEDIYESTHNPINGTEKFNPQGTYEGFYNQHQEFGFQNFRSHLKNFRSYSDTLKDFSEAYHEYVKVNNSGEPNDLEIDLKYLHNNDDHYDFIVVGSGSSGTVVASRLSENPNWRVLLLEAGKSESIFNRIPLPSLVKSIGTEYNWRYYLEPQPGIARAYKNMHMPKGKVLGGTSTINFMIYSRGNPLDFDIWSKLGNPGWSYQEVLPYFLKSEQCHLDDVNHEYHNRHGMVSVERPYYSGLVQAFIEAGGEMGYEKYSDYNGPYQDGFSHVQATMLHGERHSVARAYLASAFKRPNLFIVTKAHVTRILIEPRTLSAYGVEYYHKGTYRAAFSKKEVVLSAGAINSPQLLMLSGIGPKKDLAELGIPVLKDLPVGQTMWDRFMYPGLLFWYKKPLTYTHKDLINLSTYTDYLKYRQGPLRSIIRDGIAYIRTNTTLERPDIELNLAEISTASDFGFYLKSSQQIKPDYFLAYFAPYSFVKTMSIMVSLLHPKSRGWIKLKSTNPFEYPLIYGNYMSHRDDVKTLIDGIRFVVDMAQTEVFEKYGIKMVERRVPGCTLYGYQTDKYWECAIRTFGYSLWQPIGTVKMGPHDDPESVVDHELRVYGVRNLRVADTSIFPDTSSSHLNAPAIMVGEKAADMIKNFWSSTKH